MKIINIYHRTFFLLLAIIALSCESDFLDRSPEDEVPVEGFFKTEQDLYFAANALYSFLDIVNTSYLENITDNATNEQPWVSGYQIATGGATANDGFFLHFWENNYKYIQRANRLIENADNVTDITESKRAQYVGEAKFIRAYLYEQLAGLFGAVPFVTTSIKPEDTASLTRTAVSEIRAAIVADLTAAAQDLPLTNNEEWGRVTKGAALALKARILLYNEQWSESAAAAKEVMDLGVYTLNSEYSELFTYAEEGNNEIIFARQYADLPDQTHIFNLVIGSPANGGGWSSHIPTKSLIDTYESSDGLTIDQSPIYDEKTPWTNRDPRLHQTILYPGREFYDGVWTSTMDGFDFGDKKVYLDDDRDEVGASWNETHSGYMFYKYIQYRDFDEGKFGQEGHSIDWIVLRYPEVLLTYAEAKLEAGQVDGSVYAAINQVRQRPSVNMPMVSGLSNSDLRDLIRRERRVELAFEGLRLMDIRRWGIAETVMNETLFGAPMANPATVSPIEYRKGWQINIFNPNKDYLWPIPQNAINLNPGLTQNPGW